MSSISPRVRSTYDHLERRIRCLPAGMPLPTMPELRRELAVSQLTLERAYEALAAQGLIERKKGKGVFVADRLLTGEFAIVVKPEMLAADAHPYYRSVSANLIRLLQAENPHWQIRMHVGKDGQSDDAFPTTLDLLRPEVLPRLRGVFSFHALGELEKSLGKAKVPLVFIGNERGPNSAAVDCMAGLIEPSLRHLRDCGCKSVGLIGHMFPAGSSIAQILLRQAAAFKLTCHRNWIEQAPGASGERAGYEAFMRLWGNSKRPDGIVVQDDVMCNGVLRGTLQLGLSLPRDLKLVTFAVRGVELAYHLPVSRVEYDRHELTRRSVEMMMTLVRGEIPAERPILIPGRMIKGETT